MSGPRNIPVPRRGAMPAIGIDQIKPGNSLMVSPGNYGTLATLQAAYDWLASSDRDAEMGAASATNRRYLIRTPGAYSGDIIPSTSNVVIMDLLPDSTSDAGSVVSTTTNIPNVTWEPDTNLQVGVSGPVVGKYTDGEGKEYLLQHVALTQASSKVLISWDGGCFIVGSQITDQTTYSLVFVKQVSTNGVGGTQLVAGIYDGSNMRVYTAADPWSAWTFRGTLTGSVSSLSGGNHLCDLGDGRCFWFSYSSGASANYIWYSQDGMTTWGNNATDYDDGDPLIITTAGAIDHFHGAKYNTVAEKLYVMCGDTEADGQISLLICNDVDDLITNPANWITYWALDQVGIVNRSAVLDTSTKVAKYNGEWSTGGFRVVDIAWDSSKLWGFWIDDNGNESAWAINSTTDNVVRIADDDSLSGEGFYGITTTNGCPIFCTSSRWSNGSYTIGDQYLHLYSLSLNGAKELTKVYRCDDLWIDEIVAVDATYSWKFLAPHTLVECFGRVWLAVYSNAPALVAGNMSKGSSINGGCKSIVGWVKNSQEGTLGIYEKESQYLVDNYRRWNQNLIVNGNFIDSTTGYSALGSATLATNATVYRAGNLPCSLKITPAQNTTNSGAASYLNTMPRQAYYAGKWVTASCWVKMPSAAAYALGQRVRLGLSLSAPTGITLSQSSIQIDPLQEQYNEGWHKFSQSIFCEPSIALNDGSDGMVYVQIIAEIGAVDSASLESIYVQDVCVIEGTMPSPAWLPSRTLLLST